MQTASASVLLVDDNAGLLDLLSRALTHLGHFEVLLAENGREDSSKRWRRIPTASWSIS